MVAVSVLSPGHPLSYEDDAGTLGVPDRGGPGRTVGQLKTTSASRNWRRLARNTFGYWNCEAWPESG